MEKARRKRNSQNKLLGIRFGLNREDYDGIKAFQDGTCAICQRSRGVTKALAVDHDHNLGCGHDPKIGCRACIRGLVCGRCNRILGDLLDDLAAAQRIFQYLTNPPAQRYFRQHRDE